MESVWPVSKLSTESVGSRRELYLRILFTPQTPTRQNSFVASAVCIGLNVSVEFKVDLVCKF